MCSTCRLKLFSKYSDDVGAPCMQMPEEAILGQRRYEVRFFTKKFKAWLEQSEAIVARGKAVIEKERNFGEQSGPHMDRNKHQTSMLTPIDIQQAERAAPFLRCYRDGHRKPKDNQRLEESLDKIEAVGKVLVENSKIRFEKNGVQKHGAGGECVCEEAPAGLLWAKIA